MLGIHRALILFLCNEIFVFVCRCYVNASNAAVRGSVPGTVDILNISLGLELGAMVKQILHSQFLIRIYLRINIRSRLGYLRLSHTIHIIIIPSEDDEIYFLHGTTALEGL